MGIHVIYDCLCKVLGSKLVVSVMVILENLKKRWSDWTLVYISMARSLDMDWMIRWFWKSRRGILVQDW